MGTWRRIGGWVAVSLIGGVLVAGCGGSDPVSDQQIIEALSLVRSERDPAYNIQADPFCEVDLNLLNSEDEISQAEEGSGKGLVISNSDGTVGVQAVPPFAPDCVKKARAGLNKLD